MDLILFNGKIITMDLLHPVVQAVAVEDGKISKIGDNDEVLALKKSETVVLDLRGKLLVPGFNDSHPGTTLRTIPRMGGCRSKSSR